MLKKFSVSNYRQFKDTIEFDLSASNYSFNEDCISQDLVKMALIYGKNGTGKSTLGWAIFDLVSHLTDNKSKEVSNFYLNALSPEKNASFKFEFIFFNKQKPVNLIYEYKKNEKQILLSEKLTIDNRIVLDYQLKKTLVTTLKGTEYLNKDINPTQNLSAVKYIYSNTSLDRRNPHNKIFVEFVNFVSHMLWFRSVFDDHSYIGYQNGSKNILEDILINDNLKDFERFLNNMDLKFHLVPLKTISGIDIGVKFSDDTKPIPFFEVSSTGTKSLTLLYYWWQVIKEDKVRLLFIDEFDCSYHFSLSQKMIELLKTLENTQVILTSHNTDLLSNELIRPDCGFIIDGKTIKSLNKCTDKELRQAHNLEKLYQAGKFNV